MGSRDDAETQSGASASGESESERLDRNWNELLQELRVTQTGTQILAGFLLTLPFQQRFSELADYQVTIYLVLVCGATLVTVLGVTPVGVHRRLFRRGEKARIVALGNALLRIMLVALSFVIVGTILFIFDIVVGTLAGIIAGAATAIVLAAGLLVAPWRVRARLPN